MFHRVIANAVIVDIGVIGEWTQVGQRANAKTGRAYDITPIIVIDGKNRSMDTYQMLEKQALREAQEELSHEQLAIIDLLHLTRLINGRVTHLVEVISGAKTEIVTLQALTRSLIQSAEKIAVHQVTQAK